MNQVEQDYISDFLESLHPTDIDNRMCFKASVNSFIEERELLISPESFILDLCFSQGMQNVVIPCGFYDFSTQQQLDNDIHCIMNRLGLKVLEGKVDENGLQGQVKTFIDGELLMDATYLNNIKNGPCKIYRNRHIIFNGYYENGKPIGIATEYDLERKQDHLVEYDNLGHPIFRLADYDGSYYLLKGQEDYYSGCSCYSISERDGIRYFKEEGYFWQRNEHDSEFSYKRYDDEKYVLRSISNETNNMTIYSEIPYLNEHMNMELKPIVCYEGEYEDSFPKGFPRCGEGNEIYIQPSTNHLIYSCKAMYNDDKIIEDFQFVDENELVVCNAQVDKKKDCIITLFDPQHEYEMVYHGKLDQWNASFTLSPSQDLNTLSCLNVSSLDIADFYGKEMEIVDFSHLPFLQSIHIGSNCFPHATSVYFYHLPFLQSITIDNNCFTSSTLSIMNSKSLCMLPDETKKESFLCIKQNNSLTEISIGNHCFTAFSHVFIEDNPYLSDLSIGSLSNTNEHPGLSFYNANEFRLQQLPHLRMVQLGDNTFMNAEHCIFRDLINLNTILFGYHSFFNTPTCHFIHLPKLEEIEFQDAFMTCREAFFIFTPLLSRLNTRTLHSFSNLSSLHLLEANAAIQEFMTKNPLQTAVITHSNPKIIDPFHCIHFKTDYTHLDLDTSGSYWEGPVTEENEPCSTGCFVDFSNDKCFTVTTSFVDGMKAGWTRIYEGNLGTSCLTRDYPELLKEEGCYLNNEKNGIFIEYLGNRKQQIKGYYHNTPFLSQFTQDVSHLIINEDFLSKYYQLTHSHLFHPVVFATDEVSIQSSFSQEPLLLLNTALTKLEIQISQDISIPSLILSQLPYLESIIIHSGSFANYNCNDCFQIQHCPALKRLLIKPKSCCYFTSFILSDVPQLERIMVGSVSYRDMHDDNCFDNLVNFALPKCPALSEIVLGNYCFRNVKVFRLGEMVSLEELKIGTDTMKECSNFFMNYCSNFTLELYKSALCNIRMLYYYEDPQFNCKPILSRFHPPILKSSDRPL